ncbi:30S ribosomal protein S2 [Candidatus Dependentiae bacterium]|nr:30S ribosomal protein S2 [Candidatus Dependentiae bacterium]
MVDFKDLLKAGVHFGHKTSFGNPKMRSYVWGAKNRIHLIDVSKTAILLELAGKKLKEFASENKQILWIGTKKPAQKIIEQVSTDLNMPYVINRWIGGTLSNYGQVKKAITRLLHLQDVLKKSTNYYTKKELVMLQKQVNRLEKNIGGIIDLAFPPAAIVVVDAMKEHSAVKEAFGMGIPVIALVDTNTDPSYVSYVVPGNDDSPRSIKFVVEFLAACAGEGKEIAEAKKAEQKEEAEKKAREKKVVEKKVQKKTVEKEEVKKTVEKKKEHAPERKKVVKKKVATKAVAKKKSAKTKKVATKK